MHHGVVYRDFGCLSNSLLSDRGSTSSPGEEGHSGGMKDHLTQIVQRVDGKDLWPILKPRIQARFKSRERARFINSLSRRSKHYKFRAYRLNARLARDNLYSSPVMQG